MHAIPFEIITFTPARGERRDQEVQSVTSAIVDVDGLAPSTPVKFYSVQEMAEIGTDPDAWAQRRDVFHAQIARGPYTHERIKELSADPDAWAQQSPFILGYLIAFTTACPAPRGVKPL